MLAVLLGLGFWQLDRRDWKAELIATLETRLAMPPVVLPTALSPPDLAFRRVSLAGRFDHAAEMYLEGRTDAGRAGFHVVTPLRGTDGTVYMVDRGWAPPPARGSDAIARPEGDVVVTGVLRAPSEAGPFTPDNDEAGNHWYRIVPEEMGRHGGYDAARVAPFYVAAQPSPGAERNGLPRPAVQRIDLPNDHLNYAATWFGLAIVLSVIYVLYHRRP